MWQKNFKKLHESKVKINISLNRAGLLLISIYISNLRRRIAGEAFHLAISHRLGMTLKTCPKLIMRGSTGAL